MNGPEDAVPVMDPCGTASLPRIFTVSQKGNERLLRRITGLSRMHGNVHVRF
jgi:hypothetical protein